TLAWGIGFAVVVFLVFLYREFDESPRHLLIFVAIISSLVLAPAYLQVLSEPKDVMVIFPLPLVVAVSGPSALLVKWPENTLFIASTFVIILAAGTFLLPNNSSKPTC